MCVFLHNDVRGFRHAHILTIFKELRRFALKPQVFLEGGKVAALRRHIERCQKEGKRMLLFSQVGCHPE